VLGFLASLSGCNILRFKNPEKKALKQQKKENEKLKKAYQADVKDHYKKQTKETRKRMNKNLNKVHKDFKRKKGKSKWKCP
jgi:ClpP class serine protease